MRITWLVPGRMLVSAFGGLTHDEKAFRNKMPPWIYTAGVCALQVAQVLAVVFYSL